MDYLFAPLEGITGYLFRNAHREFYPNVVTTYYAPFISPAKEATMTPREKRDILPENNYADVVPQILTNKSEYFNACARDLFEMGYQEINLNLGCPSGTVVAKGKGSGFLSQLDELENFLDDIFDASEKVGYDISIKTRIGRTEPEEFYEILPLFNQYSMSKLIIHPRIQKEFYKNKPHLEYMDYALNESENEVIYNGDLTKQSDIDAVAEIYSASEKTISSVMIGRGLLMKPYGFAGEQVDYGRLKAFHDRLLSGYQEIMSGDKNTLYRMKELWTYLIASFPDCEKEAKQIRKCESMALYQSIVNGMFLKMK